MWPGLGWEELLFAIIISKGVCEVGGKGRGGVAIAVAIAEDN